LRETSFRTSFDPIQQLLDGFNLFRRRFLRRQCLHHQRFYRTAKCALEQIADQMALRLFLRIPGPVDLRVMS